MPKKKDIIDIQSLFYGNSISYSSLVCESKIVTKFHLTEIVKKLLDLYIQQSETAHQRLSAYYGWIQWFYYFFLYIFFFSLSPLFSSFGCMWVMNK